MQIALVENERVSKQRDRCTEMANYFLKSVFFPNQSSTSLYQMNAVLIPVVVFLSQICLASRTISFSKQFWLHFKIQIEPKLKSERSLKIIADLNEIQLRLEQTK